MRIHLDLYSKLNYLKKKTIPKNNANLLTKLIVSIVFFRSKRSIRTEIQLSSPDVRYHGLFMGD